MSTSQKSSQRARAQDPKSFSDHIGELRVRVMWVALAFIITSAVAYQYRDTLISVVLSPLGDQKLVYLTPAGGFAFIFQITMYAGAVVAAPVLIYQLYRFVQPALPKRAANHSMRIILASTLLMLAGVAFGYYVAVPSALHFLTAFAGSYIEASLTADSYLNFIVAYVVGLGLLFQLPLLLIFWNWISPLSGKKLLSSERFVVLFSFIAAAIITPTPDPANQALIAVPIIVIYQIGVAAVLIINRQKLVYSQRHSDPPVPERRISSSPLPDLPSLSPFQPEQQPIQAVVTPSVVSRPAAKRAPMIRGIDGIKIQRTRNPRIPAPIARGDARLSPPPRPALSSSGRRGLSLDGMSRAPSA